MSIKEDLVYDKHSGELVEFVNIGDINHHLTQFEMNLENEVPSDPVIANP